MAKKPCKYQLPGSDTWMSELEFKKALVDGLLDQMIMESGVSIPSLKGFSPESQKAESFKLRRARPEKLDKGGELKSSEVENEAKSEKERFSQKLSGTELDALRTSIRNKFPDSYTIEILDEVAKSIKTGDSNLPFELDNLNDGVTLNDVLGLLDQDEIFESTDEAKNFLRDRAISGDLLNAKQEATEEGVKARSYEKLAGGIRKLKIDTKGIAMSSVPGFNEAWNLSIEAAAKAVEVAGATADAIQKGVIAAKKAFKQTDFYKSLTADEKKRYIGELETGIQQTLTEEKPTSKQKKAGKEFKGKVEEATGVKPEQKMVTVKEVDLLKNQIKMESKAAKDSAKALSDAKEAVRKFIRESLPKDKYSVNEIKSIMSAISKAKDENSLNKAIDKVSDLVVKKNEQIRKRKASDIKKKIKDKRTLYTKVNGKWKGKVSVDAQNEFNEFVGKLSDLDAMSMDELTEVEDIINGIVNEGKADFNRLKAIQEDRKMRDAADMLEELAGEPDATLSDNDAIEEFFENNPEGAYVIVDGKMYTKNSYSKSEYANNINPEPIDGPAKAYRKVNLSEKKRILEEKKSILGKAKDSLRKAAVLDNIYGQLQKIGSGASKTTKFINENIVTPIKDYFIDSEISFKNRMDSYRDGLKNIFGSEKNARVRLNENASINPLRESRKQGVEVNNSVLVSLYNMSKLEDGMARLEKSGVDAQDLVDYIESNQDLLDYANFLADQYNEMRAEYEPTYISVTGMPFPEGYYYPAYTDVNFDDDVLSESDILDPDGNFSALNAMVNNLKQRTSYKGAFNTSLGAEEIFIDYVKNMERAKALIPVAKAANQLFAQQNRPYLIDKLTPEELADLQKSLATIFTGKRQPKQRGESTLNTFMNFNVVATLGLKLKSIPTQMTSFTNFWGQGIEDGISPWKVISAFPKNETEREFLTEIAYSEYLKERRKGTALDLEVKRILNTKNENAFQRNWAKFTSKAMWLPGMADYLTNISPFGGGGSYAIAQLRNELAKGNSLEEAKKIAFRNYVSAVEETQQTSREDYASSFQRGTVGRIFTTYKTSQVGFARKIVKGYRTLGDKNATDAQKAQAYYDMVYYSIASSVLFTLVSGAGYRVLRGDDDDEEFNAKLRAAYDIGMEQIQSVAQGFGFAGFIVDAIMSSAREDEWKLNIPTADFLFGLGKTGGAVIEAMSKDNYSDAKLQTERDRFIEEMGLPKESYSDEDFQQILDLYENASIWRKMDPQQRKLLLKSIGVKNIVKQAEDFYEFSQGNESFVDAFMGYEKDYFEYAKAKNKTDFIFKNLFGEDYIPKARPENESPEYVGEEVEEDIDSGIPMEEIEEN